MLRRASSALMTVLGIGRVFASGFSFTSLSHVKSMDGRPFRCPCRQSIHPSIAMKRNDDARIFRLASTGI